MLAARFNLRRPGKKLVGLVVVTLSLVMAGSATPAVAVAPPATLTVSATPADSGDLGAGAPLRLFVTLDNATVAATADATATVTVGSTPVSARATLASWFDAKSNTLATTPVGTSTFPAVAGGLSNQVVVTIDPSALPWTASGVYPVSVSIATSTKSLGTANTAVAVSVGATAPVPVAIAVPITVPPNGSEFLTAAELTQYTAPGGTLTRELVDVQDSQIAVGIDPRILASIRILGKSAPQTARDWLAQLEALPNETFPLPWADADLTAPLHAGEDAVLQTKALDYAIDPSLFPVTSTTPTPTPTSGATAPVVPTSASLVQFSYTMPLLSWPTENSVVESDLPKLNQAGVSDAILSSANVKGSADGLGGASAKSGSTGIAVSDDVLSGYLRTAIESTTRPSSTEALTELTTSLALISMASGSVPRTVLLTLGRTWANNDTNFDHSISELYARAWTSSAVVSGLFGASATAISIANENESASRIALVKSMLAAEQNIVSFAPIAKDPDALTSSTRLRLLSALSNEWTAATWPVAGKAFVADATKIVSSVQVAPSSEIVVIANQTALPVKVTNNLDQDVTVVLSVRSRTALLSVDKDSRSQSVTVEEGSQRQVQIPIEALSNGNAEIVATLFSSTGVQIGRSVTIQVNVNAGWETTGTLIFAALIAGLFAFGIVRNIRKRRKAAASE
jgi:Family of unknown function (DUF6049)